MQLLEVCLAWRNNPWLASSRTIGVNSSQSISWIHSTSLMQVATKTRLNWIIAIVGLASRRKSSFLFSSQRKNNFQFLGRRPREKEFIPCHEISATSSKSTKSAQLLDHMYVMDYFFMPLATAIPNIHLVEKLRLSFFETLQNSPEITPTFVKQSSINSFLEEFYLLKEERRKYTTKVGCFETAH